MTDRLDHRVHYLQWTPYLPLSQIVGDYRGTAHAGTRVFGLWLALVRAEDTPSASNFLLDGGVNLRPTLLHHVLKRLIRPAFAFIRITYFSAALQI
jgi:hypothetical protein